MMGVYAFIPKGQSNPLYVGYSKNIEARVKQHYLNERDFTRPPNMYVMTQLINEEQEARKIEREIIKQHQPRFNKQHKKKQIPYGLKKMPQFYEVENINYVLSGIDPYPWRQYSMIDRIIFEQNKKWIKENRNDDGNME
jgi:excinuclease UvrABC nuclease subunit